MATEITITPSMVFPTTKINVVNKLITESSLTRILTSLLDNKTYIIPIDGVDYTNTIYIEYAGSVVEVENSIVSSSLECIINGYYFNLGTITDIISKYISAKHTGNGKLSARIVIDKTIANYPELFGQSYITDTATIEGTVVSGTTMLDENYRQKDIISISAVGEDGLPHTFTVDDNYVLTSTYTGKCENGYTITFVSYYNLIQPYVLDLNETVPEYPTSSIPTGSEVDQYTIDILYYINGKYYLPITSMAKFQSTSIENIDGGIL